MTDDRGGVEVTWSEPRIRDVIDHYRVTCQRHRSQQVVYVSAAGGDVTKATCLLGGDDVVNMNISVAYVTSLGEGPTVEKRILLPSGTWLTLESAFLRRVSKMFEFLQRKRQFCKFKNIV